MPILNVVFFDIGGTLGEVEPKALALQLFTDSTAILGSMRALGFRLGVITNVDDTVGKARVSEMLTAAGIAHYFESDGLVTSTEAGCLKPCADIYRYAANALSVPIERCIYVGEDPAQVAGAVGAGMHGVLKHRSLATLLDP